MLMNDHQKLENDPFYQALVKMDKDLDELAAAQALKQQIDIATQNSLAKIYYYTEIYHANS